MNQLIELKSCTGKKQKVNRAKLKAINILFTELRQDSFNHNKAELLGYQGTGASCMVSLPFYLVIHEMPTLLSSLLKALTQSHIHQCS